MLDKIKTKPIKIEILDISPKNRAVLEFFFSNSGKSLFKKSNQDNADAFIIDYDFPGAKESWQKVFDATQKPAIVFSFKNIDLPYTVSVAKPITAKALADASIKLKKIIALKQAKRLEKTDLENKQEVENKKNQLVGEPQILTEFAFSGSNDLAEAEAIKKEKVASAVNLTTEEFPALQTEIDEAPLPPIDSEFAKPHDQDVTFNSFDLDAISNEHSEVKTNSTEDLDEPSIESLLDELSNELPEVDKLLDENTDDPSDSLDKAIPVVNNPVQATKTSAIVKPPSEKPNSTAPHIILEENEDAMVSSDDEIEALLQSIQQRTDEKEQQLKTIEQKASQAKPIKTTRELTKAEKRWSLLCGDFDDIASAEEIRTMSSSTGNAALTRRLQNISYNTKSHMFSYFLLAIKQAKRHLQVIEMKYLNRTMLIDHVLDCVYCDRTIYSESFAKFCSEPSHQADLTMRIIKDQDEIKQYRKIIGLALDTTYSIESFIWTTSMLTSRGRLPQQINISDKIKLKHWPDLTRLEQIPHAIRIAAVFYKHPGNLLEVANWLHIPQRYVFAFYNAVLALDMIEVQKVEIAKAPEPSFFALEDSTQKSQNRGLFSRLLTKLGA